MCRREGEGALSRPCFGVLICATPAHKGSLLMQNVHHIASSTKGSASRAPFC